VPERAKVFNYYGPVEVTQWATMQSVHDADRARKLASIGKPLPNVTCYVVDPASTTTSVTSAPLLQPIGVWGELWLGGVQVARGYLNRPELTAERFVRNPWPETDPSGRGVAYRTGDRVRWCAPVDI
jgi:non-ribosomal peptide synthetase component F